MHQIHLSDKLFAEAERLARACGFHTVDEYVEDVMALHIREGLGDFDHRFTPEVVAHLERIAGRIDAGQPTLSPMQVDLRIAETKKAWLKNQAS